MDSSPNPIDWKLAVLLIGHILAVGVMYGSITANAVHTQESIQEIRGRLIRMEDRMWVKPGS